MNIRIARNALEYTYSSIVKGIGWFCAKSTEKALTLSGNCVILQWRQKLTGNQFRELYNVRYFERERTAAFRGGMQPFGLYMTDFE